MECNGIPAFKCLGTSNAGITLRSIPAYGSTTALRLCGSTALIRGFMKDIINRLEKLTTISKHITLYRNFDKNIIFRNMGKITGEIDRPYIDFLTITNGASILDYCFMGFKNRSLGLNLYENNRELWLLDNLLTFKFWGCVSDSIGNSFGYLDRKNKSGGHYYGFYSINNPNHVYLVASSFSIFMNKFLSQIEETILENKEAIGLKNNTWFMDRNKLLEQDEEMTDFLKNKQETEYSLLPSQQA